MSRISVASKLNYAKIHGYHFILDAAIDRTRSGHWSKIVTLHSAMHTRPDIEWFWWLDLDAFILEKYIDIYEQVIKKYQWGLDKKYNITKDILVSEDCGGPNSFNTGSFLIRNSQWSKNAMRTVYEHQYWTRHYTNEEQDVMFWLYSNHDDWKKQVQIFPMRLANSFPGTPCRKNETHRVQYQNGDMVVHYAGYGGGLSRIWPNELEKWRKKGKLLDETEIDIFVK
ncbi:unnamed protein product [Adineta steineri]|uniref:Glycosyltransferase family 34 protein n=1 Tax=Adineta steineri TaxID=433720 RepID=A0A815U0K5_9BILA|nr:unnamed protein product [Adineta steineri]CAF1312695.1 unnamed protein product [Adineta steineri]CAF1515606.1 unnamed protein product [Adineta steineri]CAF3786305.1 unnamed protein product [Adineta steineri]CAF3987366.1 unnamed protein product [Adineta steineri]